MRTGYTYDDEMYSSQGSYQNNNRHSRPRKFTGTFIGTIGIDPVTGDIKITPALTKAGKRKLKKR